MIIVPIDRTWGDWRVKARQLLSEKILPDKIHWKCDELEFSFGEEFILRPPGAELKLPREFIELAMVVSTFRDDSTWSLMYKMAWRLLYEDKNLLQISIDPEVREFRSRYHSVRRDIHKMHAFVRFREVKNEDESVFLSWYRPDHRILRLAIPFFKDRFNGMKWIIMTEDETAEWDKKELAFLPGVKKVDLPKDEKEELWKNYYSSIFNPARVKVKMMKKEMAVRYWENLPESELITSLITDAPHRLKKFEESQIKIVSSIDLLSLDEMKLKIQKCQSCDLCGSSKSPNLGNGPMSAKLMIVGDTPLDSQSPAWSELVRALSEIGVKDEKVYFTHAVKGRKSGRPTAREISACRPWLQNELSLIRPKLLVCLGRHAAQAVIGKFVKLEEVRGKFFPTPFCEKTIVLSHPESILKDGSDEAQNADRFNFFKEIQLIENEVQELKA